MAGSVLFGAIFVVVLLLVILGIASPLWLVPIVVVGLVMALVLTPFLARLRGSAVAQPGAAPQGVPGTREASYDPVEDPAERTR